MRWYWLTRDYHSEIVATGKQPIFLLLVGLVTGFAIIRTSTRLIRAQVRWWPGNVSAGGVHLHHEFFGVLILLIAGTVEFALPVSDEGHSLLALAFGVGGGLVLDEFALLLHLKDVYWSRQGQASIDAVIVAVLLTSVLVVRVLPFGIDGIHSEERTARWLSVAIVLVFLAFTLLCVAKGKLWLGLISVFLPVVGMAGAARLAAAGSWYARRYYAAGSPKAERAAERTTRWVGRKQRFVAAIGGRADTVVSAADPPVPA